MKQIFALYMAMLVKNFGGSDEPPVPGTVRPRRSGKSKPSRAIRKSAVWPHQGKGEIARRARQIAAGTLHTN